MIAKEIMTNNVISVEPETKVTEIARLLAENTISGVPVVNSSNNVIGIVTEEDLIIKRDPCKHAPRLALFGLWIIPDDKICKAYSEARGGMSAQDIMTKKVVSFEEDTDVDEIANIMVKKKINRVPITRDGKLVGIIARTDIMKAYAGIE